MEKTSKGKKAKDTKVLYIRKPKKQFNEKTLYHTILYSILQNYLSHVKKLVKSTIALSQLSTMQTRINIL